MKALNNLSLAAFLFFPAGFLAAVASFVFQVFFSNASLANSVNNLFFFVFLEEILKLFFWKITWAITLSPDGKKQWKMFFLSLFFALGFWFLELVFLKLKSSVWPISLSSLILLLVHWLTSWLVAGSNQKLLQKKYLAFFLIFSLSLIFHFFYNQLAEKGLF